MGKREGPCWSCGEDGGARFLRQPHPAGPVQWGSPRPALTDATRGPRRLPGSTACPVAVDTTVTPALQELPVFLLYGAGNCGKVLLPGLKELVPGHEARSPGRLASEPRSRADTRHTCCLSLDVGAPGGPLGLCVCPSSLRPSRAVPAAGGVPYSLDVALQVRDNRTGGLNRKMPGRVMALGARPGVWQRDGAPLCAMVGQLLRGGTVHAKALRLRGACRP